MIGKDSHHHPSSAARQFTLVSLLLYLSLVVAGSVNAESLDDLLNLSLEDLDNYKISAPTRSEIKLSDSPDSVTLITYEQIQQSAAQTIPELLRSVAGVNVRWNPMVQTIDIRGYGSNPFTSKVLLLIDGVPYNSWNKGGFPQHPGFDFFNLDNVKHIEVVRGPGSALYGENALNGVINIVTLAGEEISRAHVSSRGGARNTRSLTAYYGGKLSEDSSLFVSGQVLESQLPTELWADESDADAKGYDIYIKGKYKKVQASWYRKQDSFDGFVHDVAPGLQFVSAKEIGQTVNIASLQFDHKDVDGRWSTKMTGSFSNRNGSHCGSCHAPAQSESFQVEEDHGYQALANVLLGYHELEHHDLLIGAEWRRIDAGDHSHEFSGSQQTHNPSEPATHHVNQPYSYRKAAIYAQDTMSFMNDSLKFIAGVRYETKTSPFLFSDELYPRIAIVSKPIDNLTVRAGWKKAARYPTFSELYLDTWFVAFQTPGGAIPLASFEPNPELQPEYIESFDLGFEYNFGSPIRAKLDLYHNEIEDTISIAYPVQRSENHPNDAIVRGLEMELKAEPSESVSMYINWAVQINQENGNGTDSMGNRLNFSYAPRHKINLGATYRPTEAFTAVIDINWKDEYMAPAFWYQHAFEDPTPVPLDDYAIVNIDLSYRPSLGALYKGKPLRISLSGKNVTNETPFETLTGFGGRITGREWYLSVAYDWNL